VSGPKLGKKEEGFCSVQGTLRLKAIDQWSHEKENSEDKNQDLSTKWRQWSVFAYPQRLVNHRGIYSAKEMEVHQNINSGVRQGCTLAPNVFLAPMDWTMSRIVSKGGLGATVGDQLITDLDYANDIALLAEMLEVLLTSLDIMQSEALTFGLEIN